MGPTGSVPAVSRRRCKDATTIQKMVGTKTPGPRHCRRQLGAINAEACPLSSRLGATERRVSLRERVRGKRLAATIGLFHCFLRLLERLLFLSRNPSRTLLKYRFIRTFTLLEVNIRRRNTAVYIVMTNVFLPVTSSKTSLAQSNL